MRTHEDRRKSLRVSVDIDLSCELAYGNIFEAKMINLSKAGICMKVTEAAGLKEKEKLLYRK